MVILYTAAIVVNAVASFDLWIDIAHADD